MTPPPNAAADDVEAYVRSIVERDAGTVEMATELVLSADGRRLAFTARFVADAARGPRRRVALLDLETRALTLHFDASIETYGPCWSPTGDRLAWIADRPEGCVVELGTDLGSIAEADSRADLHAGTERLDLFGLQLEYVRFAPTGGTLLVGAAEPGAELSDVVGSGTVKGSARPAEWVPEVGDGPSTTGWRRLWIVPLDGGPAQCVTPPASNGWQADWAGGQHIVLTESSGPSESDWYDARLSLLDVGSGSMTTVLDPGQQIVVPAASPSGRRLSAIIGAMSDRGIDSGTLAIVDTTTSDRHDVDTVGVDITAQYWVNERQLVLAGQRGLRTVVAEYDVESRTMTEIWTSDETCGDLVPTAVHPGDISCGFADAAGSVCWWSGCRVAVRRPGIARSCGR